VNETIRALLAADGTLIGLLAGGFYASPEVSRQQTPAAFDANTSELLPCANVRLEVNSHIGPHPTGSRQFFTVSLYQFYATSSITTAAGRVVELLNGSKPSSLIYQVDWVATLPDLIDVALESNLIVLRFVAHHRLS
jgi:hypothetical protein